MVCLCPLKHELDITPRRRVRPGGLHTAIEVSAVPSPLFPQNEVCFPDIVTLWDAFNHIQLLHFPLVNLVEDASYELPWSMYDAAYATLPLLAEEGKNYPKVGELRLHLEDGGRAVLAEELGGEVGAVGEVKHRM